jgi:hypothetical protein
LNVKIYRWPQGTLSMTKMFHDMELSVRYGMSVDVATPVRRVGF